MRDPTWAVQYSTVQYSTVQYHFEGYLDILVQIGSIVTQGEEYSQQHLLGIRQFDNWPTDGINSNSTDYRYTCL